MTELNEVKRGGERSDSTPYEYIPTLPYVLVNTFTGDVMGRATSRPIAENFSAGLMIKIIDTTPKSVLPDDANFITWMTLDHYRWYAERKLARWIVEGTEWRLEDLPGVTPDTVFTVLDERKNDD